MEWSDAFRASRITEVLGSGRLFSVAEMTRLQNDDLSVVARALTPLLRDVTLTNPASATARDALTTWNFVLDKDSVAAGIYEMWQRRLLANTRQVVVPAAAREAGGQNLGSTKRLIDWLHSPDRRFGASPIAGRDALVARSMDEAALSRTALANNKLVSARAICWIIPGHAQHHLEVLRERYGVKV